MSEPTSEPASEPTREGPVIAFAGPCLPRRPDARWRAALDGVELRPPARRGDVLRALAERPRALVLLDGLYYSVPSVTHKEILFALDSGVTVVGAASMGALRAAEMRPFGMVGVGRVFELFASGALDGDDEVALLHTTAEHGYRALTLALVEVRQALAELLRERGAPGGTGEAFLAAAKALPFTERSRARLLELAERHLGAGGDGEIDAPITGEEILDRVREHGVKQRDALAALERVHRLASPAASPAAASPESPRPDTPLVTTLFNQFRGWALGPPAERHGGAGREKPSYLQAWQVTQLLHPGAIDFLHRQRRRFLLASAADAAGLHPGRQAVRELAARLDDLLGEYALPALEVEAEAELEALARAGLRHFSRPGAIDDRRVIDERAAAVLAPRFGFATRGALERLLGLLAAQGDLLQPWLLARALLFTEAREPALALAESAFQVERAWSSHSRGGRLTRQEVKRVAAELFACPVHEAETEGARRGLLTHGQGEASTGTLAEAVALVAAAERLPRPANDYPRWRALLPRASLETRIDSLVGAAQVGSLAR